MTLKRLGDSIGRAFRIGTFGMIALGAFLFASEGYGFAARSVVAEARLVASANLRDEGGPERSGSDYRRLTYEFRDGWGRARKGTFNRPGWATRDERGERLRVRYAAADPSVNRPDDGDSPWPDFALLTVGLLLLVAVCAWVFLFL